MKRISPCSDWLPSGHDWSLLPLKDFSVCFHNGSAICYFIANMNHKNLCSEENRKTHCAQTASSLSFSSVLVRSEHSRQSVERRTRSVVTRADKGTFVSRAFRSTDYEGETARSLHRWRHVMETRVKQHPTVTQYYELRLA